MVRTTLIHSNSSASLASLPSKSQLGSLAPDGSSTTSTSKFAAPQRESRVRQFCQNTFRRKNVERVLPITKWLPQYDGRKAVADAIAGVTVGLTVLAQGLAYATVAGLPPIYGLYSAFAGCFVYIFLGSTKQITIGPTAVVSVLTSKYVFGKPPEYAVFLSGVTAVVTTLMAVFRLGFIANFISRPVISGFTSAVALTIVATQLGPHLGLKLHKEGFVPTIEGIIENIDACRKWDMVLSACCITILLFMKKLEWFLSPIIRGRPVLAKIVWFISTCRSAFLLFACTGISYGLRDIKPDNVNETHIFSIVGHVPPGIPTFQPPPVRIFDPHTNSTHTFTQILSEEASALIVIPLLAIVEHITIARAFAGGNRIDTTQEILTIGVSNCISCFFQSYPIAGCFSRTTVNGFSGVETPMGGLYTGVMVLLALQFLTAEFYYIPKAALASVITSSVIFMVEPEIIKPLWRSKPMDMLPWAITFWVTLLVGLEFGILVGLCISTLYLLYYAARPRVKLLEAETSQQGTKFIMIDLDRSLTFPSVDYITYQVNKAVRRFGQKNTPAVIDCHHIQYTDFTAAEAMKTLLVTLHEQGYHLIFYRMKPSTLRIVQGVMNSPSNGPPFVHCESENDLETLIDGNVTRIRTNTIEENGKGWSIRALKKSLRRDMNERRKSGVWEEEHFG